MSTFKPLESLLSTLPTFPKGASQEDVILQVKPDSATNIKSLKQAFYNAKNAGLIYAKTEHGERYWHLTEKGKAHLQGKELKLSQPVEKITQSDVDKAIQQYGGLTPNQSPARIGHANKGTTGATFNTQGQLIIWNGQDEVIFDPPKAADLIAFIANQLPWIEYCKQHRGVK